MVKTETLLEEGKINIMLRQKYRFMIRFKFDSAKKLNIQLFVLHYISFCYFFSSTQMQRAHSWKENGNS
jgi:hypothetical protein